MGVSLRSRLKELYNHLDSLMGEKFDLEKQISMTIDEIDQIEFEIEREEFERQRV